MKFSIWQRILIAYYRQKLNLIGIISPKRAAVLTFNLFCTPVPARSIKKIPSVFKDAKSIAFKLNSLIIRGYQWKVDIASPKKILVVHGFSSCAYKFGALIEALKNAHFEVLAFDAPAHGQSHGKKINALIYKEMILEAEKQFGPFNAIVAHSLGGLSAALAMEELDFLENRKLVLIAPATETTTTVSNFFSIIPVNIKTKNAFESYIKEVTGHTFTHFSAARVTRSIPNEIFWVHDEEDKICPYTDMKNLITENIEGTEFLITKGLGHSKIYSDPMVIDRVLKFITSE